MKAPFTPVRASAESQSDTRDRDLTNKSAAGVLLLCSKTKRFLIAKRGAKGAFPCTWSPFGGMVEPGESLTSAAIRELYEEAHVQLDYVIQPPVFVNESKDKRFRFFTYLACVPQEVQVILNEESLGYQWLTYAELKAMSVASLHPGFAELLASQTMSQLAETLDL